MGPRKKDISYESELTFELLRQMPARVFWKNREGVYLGCNQAFCDSLSLASEEQIIGRTDRELPIRAAEVEAYIQDDKEIISSGRPKLNIEETLTLPNRTRCVLLTNKVPLRDRENHIIGVLGICIDITERKKLEIQPPVLSEEQRYWQERDFVWALLGQLPSGVFWKNKEGVFLGCNEAFYESLNLSSATELIGKTDYDLTNVKEENDAFRADDLAVMNSKQSKLNIEESQTLKNGRKVTLLTSKVPLISKTGEVFGVLGIYTDITDRKALEKREKEAIKQLTEEKARAASEETLRRAVTVLAGSITHDLRTPLSSALIMTARFMQAFEHFEKDISQIPDMPEAVAPILAEYRKQVEFFSKKMKSIFFDMNEFGSTTLKTMQNLVAGTLDKADFTRCEIESCLYDVIDKWAAEPEKKQMIRINTDISFSFLGIPVLFYRILFNLLSNAYEQISLYKKGEIFITTEQCSDFNILRFRDTAGSVTPETIAGLFRAYHSNKKTGTGVGLAFCKLTMKSFGGDITAHLVDGDCIEFVLSFPIIK